MNDIVNLAKQAVLHDMICESVAKGGNAIIGISYNFIPLVNDMIAVSVNGTSVLVKNN